MCCPARHTHITHYCPCQFLHHTRCPLASPCPIMLHWTYWCCFYKLSGHISRSRCREVQSYSVFLLQFLLWYMVCSQGRTYSHFPPDSFIWKWYHDDLFLSIPAYKSDCLWLMEDNNIPIRSVRSYAVEMYTGQETHLCLSLQLCALQFLPTILTKFLRVFRCCRVFFDCDSFFLLEEYIHVKNFSRSWNRMNSRVD